MESDWIARDWPDVLAKSGSHLKQESQQAREAIEQLQKRVSQESKALLQQALGIIDQVVGVELKRIDEEYRMAVAPDRSAANGPPAME